MRGPVLIGRTGQESSRVRRGARATASAMRGAAGWTPGTKGWPVMRSIGRDVAGRCGRDHVVRQPRRSALAAVAEVDQRSPDDLLVEALGLVARGQPLLVRVGHPEPRRVGSVDLVDQQQLARVDGQTELVLRVGQDQSGRSSGLLAEGEERERGVADALPQRRHRPDPSATTSCALIGSSCPPSCGLGGRRDDVGRQLCVLAQPVGQVVAVDGARAVGVLLPQRRRCDAGDVAADDHLDGQRCGGSADRQVGVGHRDQVVGDDRARLLEPPAPTAG